MSNSKNKHEHAKTTNKLDARYQKSERKIKSAINSLLWHRTITLRVKDICRSAHLNSPTFYRHYRSPSQALTSLENNLVHEFQGLIANIHQDNSLPHKVFNLVFLFIYQNRSYFRTTNQRNNYYVLNQIITHTYQTIAKHPHYRHFSELSLNAYYGATAYLVVKWCKTTNFDLNKSPRFINYILALPKKLNS